MSKMIVKKKRNPQDATLRNIRALKERVARLEQWMQGLDRVVAKLAKKKLALLFLMLFVPSVASAQQTVPASEVQKTIDLLNAVAQQFLNEAARLVKFLGPPVTPPPPPPADVNAVCAAPVLGSTVCQPCDPATGVLSCVETWVTNTITPAQGKGKLCQPDDLRPTKTPNSCPISPPPTGVLVQPADWTLAGGWRLPSVTVTTSTGNIDGYSYGGHGLALSDHGTAFVGGHKTGRRGWISELLIPVLKTGPVSGLTRATIVQPLSQIFGSMNGWDLGGLLIWGQRLLGTGYIHYDANNSQVDSHFISELDFKQSMPSGPHKVNNALGKAGFVSGFMDWIPAEWQAALGGLLATGNANLSIISRTSNGPTMTVFDPAHLTDPNGAPGITVLGYPLSHDTLALSRAETMTAMAFIDGTPTVVFAGRAPTDQRIGKTVVNGVLLKALVTSNCYGTGVTDPKLHGTEHTGPGDLNCYDPVYSAKGSHGWPYEGELKFYDVRQLALVYQGKLKPWDPIPYAIWRPTFPAGWIGGGGELRGLAYDAVKRQLTMLAYGGDGSKSLPVVFQR